MSRHPVFVQDVRWKTAEHAFQGLRLPEGHFTRMALNEYASPMMAKMLVKKHRGEFVHEPGSQEDLDLMRRITWAKLIQNALQPELMETEDELIVEDVTNRNRGSGPFWGAALIDGKWVGENWLGRIWMEHRDKLFS